MRGGTYKEWASVCECGFKGGIWGWTYEMPFTCPSCGQSAELAGALVTPAHGISTDSIPGGIMIRHGLCNPDGSPRRYDSMTEIRREANKRGLVMVGDTPKQYKVAWDGIRTDK